MTIDLWTEAYRPRDMDSYVWRDDDMRAKVEEWIAGGVLPHILMSGPPGCGKTSLAELLMRELKIPESDILRVNASRERRVEDVQDRILGFVSTWALGESEIKYVLLDECDSLSPLSQRFLRNEMETYADVTRFIATCNYRHKVIEPLRGRFQEIQFKALDRDQFIVRVYSILEDQKVTADLDVVMGYVDRVYPDLRKCINLVQQNTLGGVLTVPKVVEDDTKDYLIEAIALFTERRFLEARKLIVGKAQVEDYPDIYRYFYRNLDLFGETPNQQDDALLIIKRAVVNSALAADQEILLAATMVELSRLVAA